MPRVSVLVPFPLDDAAVANRRRVGGASVKLSPGMELEYKPVKASPALLDSRRDYVLADLHAGSRSGGRRMRATTRSASTR